MEEWFKRVLSNKSIVDRILDTEDKDSILSQFDEQRIEEIKICADMLSHKDKKYMQVAELVDEYQVRVGHHPNFGRKQKNDLNHSVILFCCV